MKKVEPITKIGVDNVEHDIVNLPDNVKKLVELYEETTQRKQNAQDEHVIADAAMQTLAQSIINAVRQHVAEVVKTAATQTTEKEAANG
jgi:hypothetical protein